MTLWLFVAANTLDGFSGSIAKSETDPPHGPPVVQSPILPGFAAVGVFVMEGNSVKVEVGVFRAAVLSGDLVAAAGETGTDKEPTAGLQETPTINRKMTGGMIRAL
jgi:hypothetical protein